MFFLQCNVKALKRKENSIKVRNVQWFVLEDSLSSTNEEIGWEEHL